MSDGLALFIVSLAVVGIALLTSVMMVSEEKASIRNEAIQRGYALYCPANGHFAWKGECDE